MDKAREEMEKKKADFKAGKSLVVSPAPAGLSVSLWISVVTLSCFSDTDEHQTLPGF